jgi:D-alanine-D-alanine ligase
VSGAGLSVAVIAGGPSSEADVSRSSAAAVSRALAGVGHRPAVLELDAGLAESLVAGTVDVVFPTTHGPLGEDGCLQGLLEVLGIPYVGSGVLASALGMSKPHAKVLFRAAGLPVAAERVVRAGDDLRRCATELRVELGPSVIVKPASGGSAIGVGRIADSDADSVLEQALGRALEVDPLLLVEAFVSGREVTCGVLENERGEPEPLPPTLILPKAAEWYDFVSRYRAGGSEHRCPAPFDEALTLRIQAVAVGAHRALGARDLCRVDFVVDDRAGQVTLLEVNTLPGMTATSLFPEAAAAAGLDFETLCDRLVQRARSRPRRVSPAVLAMP